MNEQPVYVQFVDRHFGAVCSVLQSIAAHLGNTALEIVSRSIPLIVPIPNALGVFNAALVSLHWSYGAALALALAVECIFFIVFEITLKLWDGHQEDAQYRYPLIAMCIVSAICVVVVMVLVYQIESLAGGATVLAALPVLSACTSVGIGLLRWHNARVSRSHKPTVQRTPKPVQPVTEDAQALQVDKRTRAAQLRSEGFSDVQIGRDLGVAHTTIGRWLKSANGVHG